MNIAIIQSRMESTRFPGKCMKEILNIPMTNYSYLAACKAEHVSKVFLAVPDEGDKTKIFTDNFNNVRVFSGDSSDVLKRYYSIAWEEYKKNSKIENVIRITSDCPLLFYFKWIIDLVIEEHIEKKNDYTWNRGLKGYPSGLDVEVMTIESLFAANDFAVGYDREHVTSWIRNNKNYKKGEVDCLEMYKINGNYSVDTLDDFKKVEDAIKLIETRDNFKNNENN
jgi:spore coat polysaccharide biosynthesis protein SpsF